MFGRTATSSGVPTLPIDFNMFLQGETVLPKAFPMLGPIAATLARAPKTIAVGLYNNMKTHPFLTTYVLGNLAWNSYRGIAALSKYFSRSSEAIEHKALGGFPGSPQGTDTIPAWLTPGEFVVNAKAAARNRDLLEQLNSFGTTTRPTFISPTYKQGGGSIGDTKIYYNNNVTINNPTGNPALDATRIVQEINRQQSRGTARVRTA
jgi:hypothetical protein